jgi:hypothetical protein
MAWYHLSDFGASKVFSPRVTPDPHDAERLNEKLQRAFEKMRDGTPQNVLRVIQSNESARDQRRL